ncbi:MAG: GspH/FimT family pseudopilin [bacterium]
MEQQRGLSLLELLTTISIASIGLGLAIPAFNEFVLNQNMTAQSNNLVTQLNYARLMSVNSAQRLIMCPSTNQSTCTGGYTWSDGWIIFIDKDHNRNRDPNEEILRVQDPINQRITLRSSAGRPRVNFFPDGTTPGSNATFTFCDQRGADKARAIIISNVGRARLLKSNAQGNLNCS